MSIFFKVNFEAFPYPYLYFNSKYSYVEFDVKQAKIESTMSHCQILICLINFSVTIIWIFVPKSGFQSASFDYHKSGVGFCLKE